MYIIIRKSAFLQIIEKTVKGLEEHYAGKKRGSDHH